MTGGETRTKASALKEKKQWRNKETLRNLLGTIAKGGKTGDAHCPAQIKGSKIFVLKE